MGPPPKRDGGGDPDVEALLGGGLIGPWSTLRGLGLISCGHPREP